MHFENKYAKKTTNNVLIKQLQWNVRLKILGGSIPKTLKHTSKCKTIWPKPNGLDIFLKSVEKAIYRYIPVNVNTLPLQVDQLHAIKQCYQALNLINLINITEGSNVIESSDNLSRFYDAGSEIEMCKCEDMHLSSTPKKQNGHDRGVTICT